MELEEGWFSNMFTDKVMNETSFKKKNLIIYSRFGRRIFAGSQKLGETGILLGPCLSSGHSLLRICASKGMCIRHPVAFLPLTGLQGSRSPGRQSPWSESASGACAPACFLFAGASAPGGIMRHGKCDADWSGTNWRGLCAQ